VISLDHINPRAVWAEPGGLAGAAALFRADPRNPRRCAPGSAYFGQSRPEPPPRHDRRVCPSGRLPRELDVTPFG
jgi:hypothetical protein